MAEGPGPEIDPGILSNFGQPNIDPDMELSGDVEPSEDAIPEAIPTEYPYRDPYFNAAAPPPAAPVTPLARPPLDPATFRRPEPQGTFMVPGAPPAGLLQPGNTEILNRPKLDRGDGNFSTTLSMSFQDEHGREVLIPTVVNGQQLTKDEAVRAYYASGKHLGIFRDAHDADAYAQTLHNFQVTAGGGKLSSFDSPENQRAAAEKYTQEPPQPPRAPLDPSTFKRPLPPLDPSTFKRPDDTWWEGLITGFTRIATEQGQPRVAAPFLHVAQSAMDARKMAVAGERELGVPDQLALYSLSLPGDPAGGLGFAWTAAKGLSNLLKTDPNDPNYHTNLYNGAKSLWEHLYQTPWEATGELAGQLMDPLFWLAPETRAGTAAAKLLEEAPLTIPKAVVRAGDIAGTVTEYGTIGAGELFLHGTATGQPVSWKDLLTEFAMTGGVMALGKELHALTERAPEPRVEIPPEDADRILGPLFPADRPPEDTRTPDIDIQPHRDGFTVGGVNQPEAHRQLLATREEAEEWRKELQLRAAIHQVIPFAPAGSGPMPHLRSLLVDIWTKDNIRRNEWIKYWHETMRGPLSKAAGRAAARAAIAGTIAYGFGGYPSAVMFALIGGVPGLAAWKWPDRRINAAGMFNTYGGRQAVWSRATQVFHRWIVNMVDSPERRNVISMAMEGGENFEPQLGPRDVRLYATGEMGTSVDGTPFHYYTPDRREAERYAAEQGRDYLEAIDYPRVMDEVQGSALNPIDLGNQQGRIRIPIPIQEHWKRLAGFRTTADPIKTELNPVEQEVARQVREFYDLMGQAGMDAEVLKGLVRNYVSHVWEQDPETMGKTRRGTLEQTVQNIIDIATLAPGDVPPHAPGAGVKTQFGKHRRYPNLMELLRALRGSNIRIKTGDIAEIMSIYSHSMFRSIEFKRMTKALEGWPNEGYPAMITDPKPTVPPGPQDLLEQQPFEGEYEEILKPKLLPPGGPYVPKESTEPPRIPWGHTRLYTVHPNANYFRDKLHGFTNTYPPVMQGGPVYFIDVPNHELERWTKDDDHPLLGKRWHRPHWQLPPFQAFRPFTPEPPLEAGFRRLYAMEPGGTVATMEQSLRAVLDNLRTDQSNQFADIINELSSANLSPRTISRSFWRNTFPLLPDAIKNEFIDELTEMGEHPDPNESWAARGLNLTWELPHAAGVLGISPYMGYVARMYRVMERMTQGEPTRWFTTNRHLAQTAADSLHNKDFLEYVDISHEGASSVQAQGEGNEAFYYLPRQIFEHSKQMNWRKPRDVARRKTTPPAPPEGYTRLYAVEAGAGDFTSDEPVYRFGDNIPLERREQLEAWLDNELTKRYGSLATEQMEAPHYEGFERLYLMLRADDASYYTTDRDYAQQHLRDQGNNVMEFIDFPARTEEETNRLVSFREGDAFRIPHDVRDEFHDIGQVGHFHFDRVDPKADIEFDDGENVMRGAWQADGRFVGYDYKHQGWVEFTPEGTPHKREFTTDPGITSYTDMPMEYVDIPDEQLEQYRLSDPGYSDEQALPAGTYHLPEPVYSGSTYIPVEGPEVTGEPPRRAGHKRIYFVHDTEDGEHLYTPERARAIQAAALRGETRVEYLDAPPDVETDDGPMDFDQQYLDPDTGTYGIPPEHVEGLKQGGYHGAFNINEAGAVQPAGPEATLGDFPPIDREAANEPGGWFPPPPEPPPGETAQRFAAGEPRHLIEPAPGGPLYEQMPGGLLEGKVVHRDIAPQLRMLYDAKNPHDVMMALNAINMTQKRTIVMLSLFHAMNLYQAWLGAIGWRKPGTKYTPQLAERAPPITGFFIPKWLGAKGIEKYGQEHGARKAARDAMARYNFGHDPVIDLLLFYGLKIGRPMDVERGEFERSMQLIQRATDTTFPVTATGQVKQKIGEFNQKFDQFTFGELQNGFKLSVALQTFEQLLKKGMSQHRAAEIAAQYSNNIFGSLDWFRLSQEVGSKFGRDLAYAFFNPSGKRWMQLMMFAPDWTFSTFRAAYMALPGAVEDKALAVLHRRYLIKSTLMYLTLSSALNLVFTGQPINKKDPTRVALPDGRTMQFSRHFNEPWEIMQEPIQTLANKLALFPRMGAEIAYGREWIGHDPKYSPPIHHPGGNYVNEYALFFLKQFAPIFAQQGFAGGGWWSVPLGVAGVQIYGSTPEQKEQFRRQDRLERFQRKQERFNK